MTSTCVYARVSLFCVCFVCLEILMTRATLLSDTSPTLTLSHPTYLNPKPSVTLISFVTYLTYLTSVLLFYICMQLHNNVQSIYNQSINPATRFHLHFCCPAISSSPSAMLMSTSLFLIFINRCHVSPSLAIYSTYEYCD